MTVSFSLGKCKTRAGYSARLPAPRKLDLSRVKKHFSVVLETPILLVIRTEQGEVIVHGYGELIFKEGKEMGQMEKLAREIYTLALEKQKP